MAAALLMKKAEIANDSDGIEAIKNIPIYKFIIKTIYTTDGRNDFAQWMKNAYNDCIRNNQLNITDNYTEHYDKFCCLFTAYPNPIKNIQSEQKPEVIKLANAFFPCWTGTFTAFFISANSKKYVGNAEKIKLFKKDNKTYTAPTTNDVITVSGAPSIWVLSADDNTEQAKRYNAILSQCNNLVKKILWVMFVLETVDDPEVIKNLISIDKDGNTLSNENITQTYGSPVSIYNNKISIGWPTVTTPDYNVVPVPNTFYLDNNHNPHGTCMLSTILNLLYLCNVTDKLNDTGIDNNFRIPGLTSPNQIDMCITHKKLIPNPTASANNFITNLNNIMNADITNKTLLGTHLKELYKNKDNAGKYNELVEKYNRDVKDLLIKIKTYLELKIPPVIVYKKHEDRKYSWDYCKIELTTKGNKTITILLGQSGPSGGDFHVEITDIK